MDRNSIAWGAAILFVAVGLGAFGAHGLKAYVTTEALGNWKTGVEYQFYHGLGLLLLAGMVPVIDARAVRIVRNLFIAGVFCFSGSLYLLALRGLVDEMGLTLVLGPITPIGGLLLLSGWAVLLAAALGRGPRA